MSIKDKVWYADYYRSTDDEEFNRIHFIRDYIFQHRLRYMIYFRKAQTSRLKLKKYFYEYKILKLCRKYGIEIKTQTKIGPGLLLCHPYNITISPFAKIGKNMNICKGATIGVDNGKKKGAPTIGDNVYIGVNSTVVGGITIGDDVLISPNTLVNQDIPSHSLVVGNPCTIHHRDDATSRLVKKTI